MYLMAGGRERADWVRNLMADPLVSVELGGETRQGVANAVSPDSPHDARARALLVANYRKGENLEEWGRNSLPVVILFPQAKVSAS